MVSKIKYEDIKELLPEDAINYLQRIEKGFVKDVRVVDLLNEETLYKPFADTDFRDLYPRGVYLFFDENNVIKYVGQTYQGFYNRLMTQLDVSEMGHFGWNALLRKLGGLRLGKLHHELTEDDHTVDFEVIKNYKLLLIDSGTWEDMGSDELKRLEKVIMKTFREMEGDVLLNTRIGELQQHQWGCTIEQLVKK